MPRIQPVNYDDSEINVQTAWDQQVTQTGTVTNMKKTLLRAFPAYEALMQWYPLRDEVQKFLGARALVILCHAISTENTCLICSTYFRRELTTLGISLEGFALSEKEAALVEFGQNIVSANGHITDELFQQLSHYFSEPELVLLTAFCAMMVATNLINNILHVELDAALVPYAKK